MIDLLTAWLLFPAVLSAIAIGLAFGVDRISGGRIPGTLLPAVGISAVIVIGGFVTLTPGTAELTTAICVIGAVIGFLSPRVRTIRPDRAALAAAAAVYVVYALPIVASGDATFAGYIKLDDTATWLAFTEQVMERGRDLGGLAPSTFERTLNLNIEAGYPLLGFVPFGVGARATGLELAWVFQPFMALLAAFMALALYEVAKSMVDRRWVAALIAAVAGQAALLYGYSLWGGIKEIEVALLLPALAVLAAGLAVPIARQGKADWQRYLQSTVPLAVVAAAIFGCLGLLGGVWIVPLMLPAAFLVAKAAGTAHALRTAGAAAGLTLVMIIPVFFAGNSLTPTADSLRTDAALGNLIEPLPLYEIIGIWPTGDFRLDPGAEPVSYLLIALAGVLALVGIALALRGRIIAPTTYVVGGVLALIIISAGGSPWVDGKAMAILSPVALLFAGFAIYSLAQDRRWRLPLLAAAAALVIGVVWSNLLAYRDVSLAPRDQLEELAEIGEEISGDSPALMTEYQPYGARYFLRDADPEAASELRYRQVPRRDGTLLDTGEYADLDEFDVAAIQEYRTLVLRRSPAQSRPPAGFRLVRSDDYYTTWQRPPGPPADVLEHYPLGNVVDPAAVPPCGQVRRLAALAGPVGVLAAPGRAPVAAVDAGGFDAPADWRPEGDDTYLLPDSDGTAEGEMTVAADGIYDVWIGGSARGTLTAEIDGEEAGTAENQLNNLGQYIQAGSAELTAGPHRLSLENQLSSIAPSQGADPAPLGPFILAVDDIDSPVRYFSAADADQLCGKRWDWIEVIG